MGHNGTKKSCATAPKLQIRKSSKFIYKCTHFNLKIINPYHLEILHRLFSTAKLKKYFVPLCLMHGVQWALLLVKSILKLSLFFKIYLILVRRSIQGRSTISLNLPVRLLIVFQASRLECVKSMLLTASDQRSRRFLPSRACRVEAADVDAGPD